MFLDKNKSGSKYKVLLVAYKDIEEDNELKRYFISTIDNSEDIRDMDQSGNYRNSAGLSYRTALYHSWFKDTVNKKLSEGYQLGIIETRIEDSEEREKIINKLDEDYGERILVVDEAEI